MIAVLYARRDSVYKTIPDCDVWDAERDARNWPRGATAIAHPPCRAWGRLRTFANPTPGEKELAPLAVQQVRQFGGVLEHPYKSTLWNFCRLPIPGAIDEFGGWTLAVPQWWLGHKADKATWFYIVGVRPWELPPIPLRLGEPDFVVQTRKRTNHRPHIPKSESDQTPLEAALWLVALAKKVHA